LGTRGKQKKTRDRTNTWGSTEAENGLNIGDGRARGGETTPKGNLVFKGRPFKKVINRTAEKFTKCCGY